MIEIVMQMLLIEGTPTCLSKSKAGAMSTSKILSSSVKANFPASISFVLSGWSFSLFCLSHLPQPHSTYGIPRHRITLSSFYDDQSSVSLQQCSSNGITYANSSTGFCFLFPLLPFIYVSFKLLIGNFLLFETLKNGSEKVGVGGWLHSWNHG